MFDNYKRTIDYLRVSVTDRCNLRCEYCMPEEGVPLLSHSDILSFEEIVEVVKTAVDMGIRKVRLTGGEPLVRKGLPTLVGMLAAIDGIEDLALTTNGQLLETFAQPLKEAGLHRVNVSLDTIDADLYRRLTRGGEIKPVIRGLMAAMRAGLSPIKLNCVVQESSGEEEAQAVQFFAVQLGLEVRFIRKMDLMAGHFSVVEGGSGGDCPRCNRLRLTANGSIRPCLFSNLEYNVRSLGAKEAIEQALRHKPEKGRHNDTGTFYNIGG